LKLPFGTYIWPSTAVLLSSTDMNDTLVQDWPHCWLSTIR
jgi:hypothetical protein